MLLPDHEIRTLCKERALVFPFYEKNVQPASIDVTLGTEFRIFEPHDDRCIDLADPVDITKRVIAGESGFVLHPGEFALGVTEEVVTMPDDLVARIEGKSSLGRLGLIVHATAGFIDPGFKGRITLEMTNLMRLPLVLRPGQLIGQISFHVMTAPVQKRYDGRYQNSMTVDASRYGQTVRR